MAEAGLDDLDGIWGRRGAIILDHENNLKKLWTCTDKAVTVGMAGSDGFQQETVLRVFRDPEVGGAWSQQVCRQFDEDGDAVSLFLIHDETLNCGKWWERLKRLGKVDNVRYRLMAMREKCDNLDVHFESEAVA